jgi:hypothetical protein
VVAVNRRGIKADQGVSWLSGGLTSSRGTLRDCFNVAALLADPPRLLLTVTFRRFVGRENWPVYLPPPLFVSVPIN